MGFRIKTGLKKCSAMEHALKVKPSALQLQFCENASLPDGRQGRASAGGAEVISLHPLRALRAFITQSAPQRTIRI